MNYDDPSRREDTDVAANQTGSRPLPCTRAPRLLPTAVQPWQFCLPAAPAPMAAPDPAWQEFLSVEPTDGEPSTHAWHEFALR